MINLKCKTCGEILKVDEREDSVSCPCCGNVYAVPMDEKKSQYLNLYSRADDAWDHKDFEEASDLYEQILAVDNTQAEAHFGLVMCKYGITYEVDPVTQKKMPTCHRINRDSILDDKHYHLAIKYANKATAATFRMRAEEIDRISRDFLKIVDKEPPYDVFISYKKTAEDGSTLTQDSKVARKLYYHLRDKGFKVFFAEETLKTLAGELFEPYIFAALSSAPVMVLIGTKKEHIEATWVKNEWRRYLNLMNQGMKKTLIPAYFEMDPYHLPGELRNLQAMNAADYTFHEDITEIIRKKVADAKEDSGTATEVKGVSLKDKYASKDKVDKLVEATDCERDFAIQSLINFHGDMKRAHQYIQGDPDYQKALWYCAECSTANTHERCHNPQCGITKKESIEVGRARKEMEERERKNSAEHKAKVARARKKRITTFVLIAFIVAILAGLYFGFKALGSLDDDAIGGVAGAIAFVLAIIAIILRRIVSQEGGCGFFVVMYIVFAVIIVIIAFISRAIFGFNPNESIGESFATPEIVTTYAGTYKANYKEGTAIVTIASCDDEGKLTGSFEFVMNKNYGKYELDGEIKTKNKKGEVTLVLNPTKWVYQPVDFEFLEPLEATINIKDPEKMAFVCSKYNMNLKVSDGTITAATTLKTAADLEKLRGSSDIFFLGDDIDLSGQKWKPIDKFTGTLIGNGHTIKNMTIESSTSNIGFFTTLGGSVKDLNFENAKINVSGYQENIGILCGTLNGTVANVKVAGTVLASSSKQIGGIAGLVNLDTKLYDVSTLENAADITGTDCVGGIFGRFYNEYGSSSGKSQFTGFINSGNISGKNNVGGLIGDCTTKTMLTISDFKNTGSVTGIECVGGAVGYAYAYSNDDGSCIINSSCSAAISGDAYVGCIAGKAEGIQINACSNTGSTLTAKKYVTVDGVKYAYVGGFAGQSNGANDCVNEVSINYTAGGAYVGGIVGYVNRDVSTHSSSNLENKADITGADGVGGIFGYFCNNYGSSSTKTQFSGFKNSGAVTGKNEVGGLIGSCTAKTILNISDFQNTGSVTGMECVGGAVGYAYGYSNNNGSYIMNSSCAAAISGDAYVGCIVGKADGVLINSCSNIGSTLTATKYVTVDGTKYAYVGGFAGQANGANDCVNEVAINYTAGGACVGGIIGYVPANMSAYNASNLENKANITGADYVGGIFGYFYNKYGSSSANTQLSGFKNSGTISGNSNVGGLIGNATAKTKLFIIDFVNTGMVNGVDKVGGVVGYCYGYKDSYIQDSTTTNNNIAGVLDGVTVK